jgi:glycolate oxidase FAD binding subunit
MNQVRFEPCTPIELADAVRSAPRVLAVGAATKPRLSAVPGVTPISTRRLSGILDYDPTEFTFTALAGTSLREIVATLAERGQSLPFDPPLAEAGATIGGTVAAGLSGAGRFRFGGVRDFILGIRFVDGAGRLLRMGGKVVKNAAGFDLPKFFVGSLGRFGAIAEMTFKVFPQPPGTLTLKLEIPEVAAMAHFLAEAGSTRWELDALDASLTEGAVYARLAGPAPALGILATEILQRRPGRALTAIEAAGLWEKTAAFDWAHGAGGVLLKAPLTPAQLPALAALLRSAPDARSWISAGGAVAWLSFPSLAAYAVVGEKLHHFGFDALTLRGAAPLWSGRRPSFKIYQAVKTALDPHHRFPSLDD